jgi:hypothetical protein
MAPLFGSSWFVAVFEREDGAAHDVVEFQIQADHVRPLTGADVWAAARALERGEPLRIRKGRLEVAPATVHERWCPLADGYSGPDVEGCHCGDEAQQDGYYDAMDRLDR